MKNIIIRIQDILNSILKDGTKQRSYPEHFIDKYNIYNKDHIVYSFNRFFVSVLADKILDPGNSDLIDRNPCSVSLSLYFC